RCAMPAHDHASMPGDDLVRPDWLVGRVFACALRDRLVARARAGDPVALQALLMLLPDDAPPSFCRAERDRELRQLADELFAAHPSMTLHGAATLLAAAGDRIEGGRRTLTGKAFDMLEPAEARELADQVAAILDYAPSRHDGRRWPSWRQI